MIDLHFYNSQVFPQSGGPILFLAGITTDEFPSGRGSYRGQEMSAWRAAFCELLERRGFSGIVVVPEFGVKGSEAGWFAKYAERYFGDTQVPQGMRGKPASVGIVRWEERHMASADVTVAWKDVRRTQPGLGLNARPEIYGLILRWRVAQAVRDQEHVFDSPIWAPGHLILGIPETAQAVTRDHLEAFEAGLPVYATLGELARQAVAAVAGR